MRDQDWTKILDWPGYRVYRHEINEKAKTLRLWVRRKSGNQKLVCSGCGQRAPRIHGIYEREVRDLPWSQYQATVVIELYRVDCPDCGVKAEKIEALPSKAPFSQRFEDAVGQACESAPVRRVERQFALPESTVRASICAIWSAGPRDDGSRRCGRWGWMKSIWVRARSF
jgi:transposase